MAKVQREKIRKTAACDKIVASTLWRRRLMIFITSRIYVDGVAQQNQLSQDITVLSSFN
jgi:hypothetical protein